MTTHNWLEAQKRLAEAYETIDFHGKKPSAAWLVRASQAHTLLAIHDEQRTQTGLLADLRGAIDDLAEALRPKVDHDRIGSRCIRPNCMELHDPEPDVKSDPGPEPAPRALICTEAEAEAHREVRRLVITTYQIEDDPSALRGIDGADMTTSALAWLDRFVTDADPDVHPAYTGKPEKPMPGGRATGDDLSAPQPSEAPADGEGTW